MLTESVLSGQCNISRTSQSTSLLTQKIQHAPGSTWVKVATPAAADFIGPIARDGHGGLWVASVPPGTCPGTGCDTVTMLHRHAAGTWTRTVVTVANLGLTAMRLIPGTTSLWASGNIITRTTGSFVPVILKYGP